MNTKKINFLCSALLCINMLQSPAQATIKNENATFCPDIAPSIYVAAGLYLSYNYLVREDNLVKNKYPIAQTWYDGLAKKYPTAHLEQKHFALFPQISFIPTALSDLASSCSWSSHYNHIYFSDADLGEITILYQKVLDGYPLHEEEQLSLAKKEFKILHEAGHIEHDDAKEILMTMLGLFTAIKGIEFIVNDAEQPSITKRNAPEDYTIIPHWPLSDVTTIPGIVTTYQGVTFMTGLIGMIRYQELQADKFACQLADDKTLKSAIGIFEDQDMDALYDIENGKISPYVTSDSTTEKIIQTVVGPVEFVASAMCYQMLLLIKSIPQCRWMYDFKQDPIHQGPSVRAQFIKDELERRENDKSQ